MTMAPTPVSSLSAARNGVARGLQPCGVPKITTDVFLRSRDLSRRPCGGRVLQLMYLLATGISVSLSTPTPLVTPSAAFSPLPRDCTLEVRGGRGCLCLVSAFPTTLTSIHRLHRRKDSPFVSFQAFRGRNGSEKLSCFLGPKSASNFSRRRGSHSTRAHASFLDRRRLTIRQPDQIDKALRRGVPLRSLDVSGDLRPPAYEFNPMLVLQFANLVDSVITSPTAAPSREDRTAFLRLLSEAAGCDNGASILAVAKKYKELADLLLDAVHPVLLSMYRRKLDSNRGGPHKDSQHRLALAIEGGAMRGCVTAGMAVALHHMGYADTFDAVFGSSAGSLIGAYFISRQLPYEGTQIYYDWLPFMGKKFLDLKRIGRGLGLGFLLDGDIIDFLINKLGKPLLNLDILLRDIVQEKQPLDWDKFKANDSWQPLKVVTSGLCSQRAIVLDSKHGNIRDLPSLMACVRASMLLPGLAGPVVHLPIYPESTNLTPHYLPLITPSALPRFAPQAPCGFVSEPLADALLYEPVPFRSAIADGYDQVLVLRSRPDGKRVGRLGGIEAAVENRLARRFFAGKHKLRHVYEYMKQRQHRIRYMKDMLMLNEATNRHSKLQVAGLDGVEKEGHAFAVALDPSTAEIARISMTRKHILEGVRAGFARLYDVIIPDPQKRGRGYEEALKVFPANLPGVTEAFTSSTSSVSSFPLVPPLFDDSSEVTTDPKELEDYVIRAAAAERERRNLLANDANS